jgi:hypothetical protein
MPSSGFNVSDRDQQSGCRAGPTITVLWTRIPIQSSAGVGPWKNTIPRSYWIKSMPVLSLAKACHPPQTLFLSHGASPRRLDQALIPRANVRHPIEIAPPEFETFLPRLAVERNVAACPQNHCAACHACPACPEVSRGEASRGERCRRACPEYSRRAERSEALGALLLLCSEVLHRA